MKVGIVGAPIDLGQKRRGVDMGPSAMRIADLAGRIRSLGHEVIDYGNIPAPDMSVAKVGDPRVRYLDEVVAEGERLAKKVSEMARRGLFPLVLGGDQSISIGTAAGLAARGGRRGVIWMDAHGDFNTPSTTPSGNIHGVALAAVLGYGHPQLAELGGVSPKAVERSTVIVGVRSLDPKEANALSNSKVTVYTMREIDELGMRKVMENAIQIASKGVSEVHICFDIDVIDPREAPGTGTPVKGGLSYREAHLSMEMLHDSGKATSAELVEVNPILDAGNQTAELAVELLLSFFGKKIFS